MEEQAEKVRLVRCPKCKNLLPELPDFSVYQCGGCGAILRAKNKSLGAGGLSEKSAEQIIERGSQKSDHLSEKGVVPHVVGISDADMSPETTRQDWRSLVKGEFRILNGYKDPSKDTAAFEGDYDMNRYGKGLSDVDMQMELNKAKPSFENVRPSQKPERYSNRQNIGGDEVDGRNLMNDVKDARLPNSSYSNEGPSNYPPCFSYGYKEQTELNSEPEAPNKVDYLEQNRADLLRKLDELKDHFSKSLDIAGKPKENAPLDRNSSSQQPYSNPKKSSLSGSSMPNRDPIQFMARDRITDPPYLNRFPDPYSYRPEMVTPNILPSVRDSSLFNVYGDSHKSHLHQRPMHQVPGQYNERSRPYISGQYLDNGLKPFEQYPYSSAFHHPSCTCFHCYNTRQYVTPPIPPSTFRDRRFRDSANDPMFYLRENHPSYTSHAFNSQSLSSHDALTLMRGTSDLKSEEGSLHQTGPHRTSVGSSRLHPVAGGAPFITCCNCFELLHLPGIVLNMDKDQKRLRCGACSAVISYAVIDRKLVFSVSGEKRQISDEADDNSSEMMKGKKSDFPGRMNGGNASYSFNDNDNTGYEFESLDREPGLMSSGHASNSSKQQDMQTYHSASPSTSDNENSPDVFLPIREEKHSFEKAVKASLSPPPAGSPLKEYFDYSNYNNQVNRFGKGNQSSRSGHENQVFNKPTTRQNSVKEAAVATEMDVPYNDFTNTGVSQDSGDGSREYDQRRVNKGGESLLGIIKNSFSWSNQAAENCKASVSINGHPVSDRLVKKAEKLSGPVRPGQYWYDFRAGFWGVMGGPCLGIIPPSIEEFNHPMPGDCAGGDTGVYVNGRELHHKDLDLLISRGLPTERDRSYIIEISGRVWDEHSREELDCLGKLAPTIEKEKHGFGMKVPRISA